MAVINPVSLDKLFQSFVEWHGEIPREARRLNDREARARAALWRPERFTKPRPSDEYVLAYELGARWWVLMFQRKAERDANGHEHWWIEAYTHDEDDWASDYFYSLADQSWRHFLSEFRGQNYGRYA